MHSLTPPPSHQPDPAAGGTLAALAPFQARPGTNGSPAYGDGFFYSVPMLAAHLRQVPSRPLSTGFGGTEGGGLFLAHWPTLPHMRRLMPQSDLALEP